MSEKQLLEMLRREEERSRILAENLQAVIQTIENVRDRGGWESVGIVIAKARVVLRAV